MGEGKIFNVLLSCNSVKEQAGKRLCLTVTSHAAILDITTSINHYYFLFFLASTSPTIHGDPLFGGKPSCHS